MILHQSVVRSFAVETTVEGSCYCGRVSCGYRGMGEMMIKVKCKLTGMEKVSRSCCLFRVTPWEHQAELLHGISPISMKLCQFKGSTPKPEKTNWFVIWIFQGEDMPPPLIITLSPWKLLQIGQNIWSSQYNCVKPIALSVYTRVDISLVNARNKCQSVWLTARQST